MFTCGLRIVLRCVTLGFGFLGCALVLGLFVCAFS